MGGEAGLVKAACKAAYLNYPDACRLNTTVDLDETRRTWTIGHADSY